MTAIFVTILVVGSLYLLGYVYLDHRQFIKDAREAERRRADKEWWRAYREMQEDWARYGIKRRRF